MRKSRVPSDKQARTLARPQRRFRVTSGANVGTLCCVGTEDCSQTTSPHLDRRAYNIFPPIPIGLVLPQKCRDFRQIVTHDRAVIMPHVRHGGGGGGGAGGKPAPLGGALPATTCPNATMMRFPGILPPPDYLFRADMRRGRQMCCRSLPDLVHQKVPTCRRREGSVALLQA